MQFSTADADWSPVLQLRWRSETCGHWKAVEAVFLLRAKGGGTQVPARPALLHRLRSISPVPKLIFPQAAKPAGQEW